MLAPERQGEIALLLIKSHLRKKGLKLNQETRREIGNVGKEIGVSLEELLEFMRPLVEEITDGFFADENKK